MCVLRQLIQIKDVLLVKLTSRISTEFCTNVCVCMCTSVSANLPKEGSMKKPSAHSWLFPDTSVGRQGCVCLSACETGTDLYSVPKVVVLGDAKSECTDDILGGGPILHHMITAGLKKKR